jgi:hypothetical protein
MLSCVAPASLDLSNPMVWLASTGQGEGNHREQHAYRYNPKRSAINEGEVAVIVVGIYGTSNLNCNVCIDYLTIMDRG